MQKERENMSEMPQYFLGGELSGECLPGEKPRIPVRPLGFFSDFVVGQLPEYLEQLHSGEISHQLARDSIESLAEELSLCTGQQMDTLAYDIGRLGVMMAYVGLAHSGVKIGEKFSRLVEYFSQEDLPALTYEDIIMHNPSDDPRTFTHGKAGSDEASFYKLHKDLEKPMGPLVDAVREFVQQGPKSSFVRIQQNMQALGILFANTKSSGMGMAHFDEFRGYLNGIPGEMLGPTLIQEEHGGPSGTFSPTVHELDLLVCGIRGDSELAEYVVNNRKYFPSASRRFLDGAIALVRNGKSLMDYVRESGDDPQLVILVKSLLQPLLNFRSAHLGAVKRQVPALFKDETAAGTGGIASSVPFLRHRLEKIRILLSELDAPRRERRNI